ncbi:M23 family metallopeptidase [Streptomyces sp. NBC_00237]|uniref:M23 family metallopeptidase n=1 Tax=Streptomyces sp. NBC_00237 TaxID=2975687 RepID=UPI00224E618F|nr:M23 family metallopeptidase [Streptomyces sp. NBC_00237]MCX5199872.1 M23 family metallopeptidase [Streptomyces sp. NBC_00237]
MEFDAPDGSAAPAASAEEWNPTADTLAPVRGKHRVAKQRGSLARSSTVLGVGVIAAVGAGGIATAQDKPAVSISLPDQITESLDSLADSLPDATSLPGVGALVGDADTDADDDDTADAGVAVAAAPAAATHASAGGQSTGAGESLRARILQQADQQRAAADEAVRQEAREQAVKDAAAEAKKAQKAADAKAEQAEKEQAAKEAREKAAAEAKAEAERLAKLAASFSLPVSSYTLTATYGQAGSMWSSGQHTGLDFAGQAGTPLKAVHGATVKSAGWSGPYGYRIVLELQDGTEVWYAHLSQMNVSAGQQVTTGQVIGNMGATGNVSGVHLHLEVHTPGGDGIDPAAWLRGKGLTV